MPSPKFASEALIERRQAKVIMNRAALDAAQLGMADGLLEIGLRIIADAAAAAPREPGDRCQARRAHDGGHGPRIRVRSREVRRRRHDPDRFGEQAARHEDIAEPG